MLYSGHVFGDRELKVGGGYVNLCNGLHFKMSLMLAGEAIASAFCDRDGLPVLRPAFRYLRRSGGSDETTTLSHVGGTMACDT